ncbi:glycosyltransferase family 39 protein [Paenibacillus sp. EKM202P]|uniref:ArnT family glycosyltransferase n=1 Tax=unclassified Paenibacillus TaxID=185978 RepID=UPI001624C94F|nr:MULTISPECIES: glycosyltransferase family 39 protein [unclassified Paenibacillus]KAF6562093.1 glycosyltransferase family 39 protein [Paenibacillus sp. EKM202P]KAF6566505.1 glycosyltransferase family 39 protein [Paenibacillus sp. EKM207P]
MIKKWFKTRADIPLIIIMLISAFLNGYNIWQDKYVNTYYTTAVASMLQSFHNFFFASLDSAGSVTVDKPPVVFWIQTLSAYIFGLHGWSVILPQALAQVGSVLLVYLLVKPSFGTLAARLAAFAMATTPIAVAVSRTNNIDAMLVFTLLLATWLLFRGLKNSKTGLILAAFAVVGIAFNEKMLQAYMIVPALGLFYLLASKYNWKRKAITLAGSAVVLLIVSLSWAVVVDSTPADERPYMGSSGTNSVLNLAFGYNGLSRLTGDQGTGGNRGGQRSEQNNNAATNSNITNTDQIQTTTSSNSTTTTDDSGANNMAAGGPGAGGQIPPGGFGGNGQGGEGQGGPGGGPGGNSGGSMFGTGEKGPLRLFQSSLSGQASWLLPFAIIASIGLLASIRRRNITRKHKEVIFWLAWLIPVAAFFSVAGFFHHYYLIMLAPPIAALFGAGFVELWQQYRERSNWLSWLLPVAVLATSVFSWFILQNYNDTIGSSWSIAVLILGIIGTALLVVARMKSEKFTRYAIIASVLAMFIGPVYWALTPIVYGGNSMIPQAGPTQFGDGGGGMPGRNDGNRGASFNGQQAEGTQMNNQTQNAENSNSVGNTSSTQTSTDTEQKTSTRSRGMGGPNGSQSLDQKTLSYLQKNNTGETYLFAASNYSTAAPYLVEAGQKVIIMNGFVSSDPVYTVDKIKALVESGQVKYFMISGGGGGPDGGNSEVTAWIKEHGKVIPTDEWKTTTTAETSTAVKATNSGDERGGSGTLYEITL